LSQINYIPFLDILSEINTIVSFTNCFKHHGIKNIKRRPKDDIFSAGIIGLGCNIGVPKMAQISTRINQNTLRNTVTWYFSLKNVVAANQSIIAFINKLLLPDIFIQHKIDKHSSSDGRKVNVAVNCLLANKSFKYFGKDSGVSIYTFIDERQMLFYSTVISASEREAAYVIDGLNNNDVTKMDIHSTDSHGYTELIFAAMHFFETAFAPRLKNIGKQKIYAFSAKETYEKKGFKVLPSRIINQNLIQQHWNDILRFMVTIKLKEVYPVN
jgi:TnpA family transposase